MVWLSFVGEWLMDPIGANHLAASKTIRFEDDSKNRFEDNHSVDHLREVPEMKFFSVFFLVG